MIINGIAMVIMKNYYLILFRVALLLHFCCTLFSIITKNIKVNYTSVRQEASFIKDTAGRLSKADLIVPETETGLQGFIGLKDDKTRKPLDIPEDGVIISRTYEKHHDIMELPKKMLIYKKERK